MPRRMFWDFDRSAELQLRAKEWQKRAKLELCAPRLLLHHFDFARRGIVIELRAVGRIGYLRNELLLDQFVEVARQPSFVHLEQLDGALETRDVHLLRRLLLAASEGSQVIHRGRDHAADGGASLRCSVRGRSRLVRLFVTTNRDNCQREGNREDCFHTGNLVRSGKMPSADTW